MDDSAGIVERDRLRAGLILRAFVNDLAVVHVQLARVHGIPARGGAHMEVLDPMEVGQRNGKPFSLFRRDKVIDVDGMNRLITGLIATTVAQRFPASGEAGQKDVSHKDHPSGACHDSMCATALHDFTGMLVDRMAPLALCPSLLENLVQFAQHLPSLVGGVMLAQLGSCLVPTQLVDPIPEQLRPTPNMPGELLEVLVEEPISGDGLTLATEQIPMHEIMMLVAWEDAQLNLRVQRRDAGHDRQIIIDIRTPILANGQHVNILLHPLEERFFVIRYLNFFILCLEQLLVFLDAPMSSSHVNPCWNRSFVIIVPPVKRREDKPGQHRLCWLSQ
jgi:hypothetical protein